MRARIGVGLASAVVAVLVACAPCEPIGSPWERPTMLPGEAEIVMAAGDIAHCPLESDSAVGELIASEPDATVVALGDLVYPAGTEERYETCYDEAWGSFRDRTRPAIGNHDVMEDGGAAYHSYFGDAAGTPGEGWYAYSIGQWDVVVLNTNCDRVGCEPGSAQHDWLVSQLGAADARCVLAYFHHPITGSGEHGRYPAVDLLWDVLVEADADLVLAGHEHHYERFRPLGADAQPDPDGVPLIIVGTGGIGLRDAHEPVPGSDVLIDDAHGALRLTLLADGYEWQFLTTRADGNDGVRVRDSGTDVCS